jgi:hypothetical protein
MEKLRVNLVIEGDADQELFNYLVNIPARRRATLIRTLATQGMNSEGQLKVFAAKVENKPTIVNLTAQVPKKTEGKPESNDTSNIASENEKEKALNRAIGSLDFQ